MKPLATFLILLFLFSSVGLAKTQEERQIKIEQIKQNHLRAREGFTARKEAFQRTVELVQDTREDFLTIRERFADSKDPVVREEYLLQARNHLVQLLDSMTSYLLRLKTKIENASTLEGDERRGLLTSLDNRLSKIAEFKSEVRNITDPDLLRDAAQRIKSHWREIKKSVNWISFQFLSHRFEGFLSNLQIAVPRVEDKVLDLQNLGHNTDSIETPLKLLETSITNAQTALTSAKRMITELKGDEETINTRDAIMPMLRETHTHLQSGSKALNQIIRNVKVLLGNEKPEKESDLEAEQATTTEAI